MTSGRSLENTLGRWAQQDTSRADLVAILKTIAHTGAELAGIIARYDLVEFEATEGDQNADGDLQKPLDLFSHQLYLDALREMPITFLASEESDDLIEIDSSSRYGIAIDPLDGSSNIETNLSIGSIFSVLEIGARDLLETPLGRRQRAAGFICFGPQTRLVLTYGEGVEVYLFDPEADQFFLVNSGVTIPSGQPEFAINTSNYRFWDDSVRHFIDDCIAGEDGNLGRDFNMRWNASLVAEAFRILMRGGVFLYPGDSRSAYRNGRLRLLYEALPLAMIVEQAGGRACDGTEHILDKRLESLHQRVPLIFGSHDRVEEVIEYISGVALETTHFPLFEHRGLFRN